MRHLVPFIILTGAIGPGPGGAQSQGTGPALLELPASTPVMAMGDAVSLHTADARGVFYTPALTGEARGVGADAQFFGSAAGLYSVSAARPWGGGGLALAIRHLSHSTLLANVRLRRGTQSELLESGPVGATETVAAVSYGRQWSGFHLGLTAAFVEQSAAAARDRTAAVDLGAIREVGRFRIGLAALNLGRGLDIATAGAPLPGRLVLATSLDTVEVGPLDLLATASVTRRQDAELVPRGGVEISWWPVIGRTFTLRAGIQRVPRDDRSPLTFGVGFTGDDLAIEYAFQSIDGSGNAHRVGVRWR